MPRIRCLIFIMIWECRGASAFGRVWIGDQVPEAFEADGRKVHGLAFIRVVNPDKAVLWVHLSSERPEPVFGFAQHLGGERQGEDVGVGSHPVMRLPGGRRGRFASSTARVRRAHLQIGDIRGVLPARLRQSVRRAHVDRPVPELLQRPEAAPKLGRQAPDQAYFNALQPIPVAA